MGRFGLVGPSYQSQSVNADAQRTANWYVEAIESGEGKSQLAMYPRPGMRLVVALPGMRVVRGELETNGRLFVVGEDLGQQYLFEISANGAATQCGVLGAAGTMASLAVNNAAPAQLLIASGGRLFLMNLGTNVLGELDTTGGPAVQGAVAQVAFSDGYFIALLRNNEFQLSALLDGRSWDPNDVSKISVFADNVVGMMVDHREIVFWGAKHAVVYYNSGGALFPFDVVPGGFAEMGSAAGNASVRLDNSLFWIGQDEHGQAMAWRSEGYSPKRVSNHAIEFEWQGYATISDAIGYSLQYSGHSWWVILFPTAGKTWVYDCETGWCEWTSGAGAHWSNCHAFAFGKHLVGDWNSGNLYELSTKAYDDAGTPIEWQRRAPAVAAEDSWMYFNRLDVDVETGLGPMPPLVDGQGQPRGPQLFLRWSDDGGHTWSNPRPRDCGQAGKYRTRVYWNRLGRARVSRIFEISCSDAVPWRVVDAYLEGTGFQRPTERLAKQMAKQA